MQQMNNDYMFFKKIEGNEIWHLNFDVFKNHFRNKIILHIKLKCYSVNKA